jgi:invasion protein IalB
MKRNTIYAIAGGVLAVLVVAVGGFFYFRGATNPGVPPLPANARMFNNWALIGCQPGANDGRCVLLRRAVNQQTGRLVMQMTIARAQNGGAVMAITLPPNVVIPAGITLTPMGGTAVKGPIRACRPQACTGALALTDTLAKEMAANDTTALEFTAANGRAIRMNVNVQGFAQGFAAWQQAAPAPPVVANPAAPAAAQQAAKAAPPAAAAPAAPAARPRTCGAQPAAKAAPAAASSVGIESRHRWMKPRVDCLLR